MISKRYVRILVDEEHYDTFLAECNRLNSDDTIPSQSLFIGAIISPMHHAGADTSYNHYHGILCLTKTYDRLSGRDREKLASIGVLNGITKAISDFDESYAYLCHRSQNSRDKEQFDDSVQPQVFGIGFENVVSDPIRELQDYIEFNQISELWTLMRCLSYDSEHSSLYRYAIAHSRDVQSLLFSYRGVMAYNRSQENNLRIGKLLDEHFNQPTISGTSQTDE